MYSEGGKSLFIKDDCAFSMNNGFEIVCKEG
jgi:hypothetical protein